jgi:hypothetical protein
MPCISCLLPIAGYHFHADKELLEDTKNGDFKPYLFHANWMEGKKKGAALQTTHNWFVKFQCGNTLKNDTKAIAARTDIYENCCLRRPFVWPPRSNTTASTSKHLLDNPSPVAKKDTVKPESFIDSHVTARTSPTSTREVQKVNGQQLHNEFANIVAQLAQKPQSTTSSTTQAAPQTVSTQ